MKIKILLLSLLFIFITFKSISASPIIVESCIQQNSYTSLIEVYSNSKITAYIPDDMINFNLFWTNYPKNGNFNFKVYIEWKDEAQRQNMINGLRERINKNQLSAFGRVYPDLLKYTAHLIRFDMQNNRIEVAKDFYIDQDGAVIGWVDNSRGSFELNEKNPAFTGMANSLASILEREKSSPKNADIIADMEAQGVYR